MISFSDPKMGTWYHTKDSFLSFKNSVSLLSGFAVHPCRWQVLHSEVSGNWTGLTRGHRFHSTVPQAQTRELSCIPTGGRRSLYIMSGVAGEEGEACGQRPLETPHEPAGISCSSPFNVSCVWGEPRLSLLSLLRSQYALDANLSKK